MVRAGQGSSAADVFLSKGVVGIGWYGVDWSQYPNKAVIMSALVKHARKKSMRQLVTAGSQIERFLREIEVGDRVTTHDSKRRVFLLGRIKGNPIYDPTIIKELPTLRTVNWDGTVQRDKLSHKTLKGLGAISTLFVVSDAAAAELEANLEPL